MLQHAIHLPAGAALSRRRSRREWRPALSLGSDRKENSALGTNARTEFRSVSEESKLVTKTGSQTEAAVKIFTRSSAV